MARYVIHTSLSRPELFERLRDLPMVLSGSLPDRLGIARGFRLRLAHAFFEKIKLAFIAKSRGSADEAGIKWKKLSRKYLAYGRAGKATGPKRHYRRFAKGEQAKLKKGAGLTAGRRYAPGGQTGLLSAAQLRRWKKIFITNLGWLATRYDFEEAKSRAAAIAWNQIKREGGQTKLNVFGSRTVDILKDTGLLLNSLGPGLLSETGADASYAAPPDQVVRQMAKGLLCGTNVQYAGPNHRIRPLWPDSEHMPESWLEYFARQAARGLPEAIRQLAEG